MGNGKLKISQKLIELVHLTNDEEDALIAAATIIESLLDKYLYKPLGKDLPQMDR